MDNNKEYGPEVNGLASSISLEKTRYRTGEPVLVQYEVKNVSDHSITLWHSVFWANHQILIEDQHGASLTTTEIGAQVIPLFSPGGPRRKNFPVVLEPDTSDYTEGNIDLRRFYVLTEGAQYNLQIVYEENPVNGWSGILPSNVVRFSVD